MTTYLLPSYSARTDTGRRREHNEDYVHAGPLLWGDEQRPAWHLFAVADGVGGHQRGEWASETAVSTLTADLPARLENMQPTDALRLAFQAANSALWQQTGGGPTIGRAATTLVAALVGRGILWWASVGDSRAYLLRRRRVAQLTQDHTWVEEQVLAGNLTPDEAKLSEHRNVITRSIGGDAEVKVDVGGPTPLRSGDALILCSDGLHGLVSDDEMAAVVQQLLPEAAAERLVTLSNERGGPDNISVIVCAMFDASPSEQKSEVESLSAYAVPS
jgi:PPM family protein phosphatase